MISDKQKQQLLKDVLEHTGEAVSIMTGALVDNYDQGAEEWINALHENQAALAVAQKNDDSQEVAILEDIIDSLRIALRARLAELDDLAAEERSDKLFDLLKSAAIRSIQALIVVL